MKTLAVKLKSFFSQNLFQKDQLSIKDNPNQNKEFVKILLQTLDELGYEFDFYFYRKNLIFFSLKRETASILSSESQVAIDEETPALLKKYIMNSEWENTFQIIKELMLTKEETDVKKLIYLLDIYYLFELNKLLFYLISI